MNPSRATSPTAANAAAVPSGATVSVNGRVVDGTQAMVSVFDHGFLYGEGVYETLRTYGREPFLFDRHAARLRNSARLIALDVPYSDERLRELVMATLAAHEGRGEAYVRVLLTRGVGDLTYRPSACPTPTLIVIVKPFVAPPDESYERGVGVVTVDIRRNHRDALNPAIKSNNLLNNALAMQAAYARGADEALMLNLDGRLAECAQSNVFLVIDGSILTPPLSDGLLPGITRELVLELATELGLPAREVSLGPEHLTKASEAFLTGTTREVTPIVQVDERQVGGGLPGPLTKRLIAAFREKTIRRRPR